MLASLQDFEFGFNMLMGSVSGNARGSRSTVRTRRNTGRDANEHADEEAPIVMHTFTSALFPDARPMRIFIPLRPMQGADLRVEDCVSSEVGTGIPYMSLRLMMNGLRLADYGALEGGGVFPTLVGGPAEAPAWRPAAGSLREGGVTIGRQSSRGIGASNGKSLVTLAFYTGGRLELGCNLESISLVAMPDRFLVVLDVVLACLTGPPAARKAREMDALEQQVADEEEEEAMGARVGELVAPNARQEALSSVRGAYLYFGRMDARITIRGRDLVLLLVQDSRNAATNVVMAEVRL